MHAAACSLAVPSDCTGVQIIFAREFLKEVRMKEDQVKYLVTNARNGMCQGHRAELFAVKAAKACAALAVSYNTFILLSEQERLHPMLTHGIAVTPICSLLLQASAVLCQCSADLRFTKTDLTISSSSIGTGVVKSSCDMHGGHALQAKACDTTVLHVADVANVMALLS